MREPWKVLMQPESPEEQPETPNRKRLLSPAEFLSEENVARLLAAAGEPPVASRSRVPRSVKEGN